jgi:hypothetical protein
LERREVGLLVDLVRSALDPHPLPPRFNEGEDGRPTQTEFLATLRKDLLQADAVADANAQLLAESTSVGGISTEAWTVQLGGSTMARDESASLLRSAPLVSDSGELARPATADGGGRGRQALQSQSTAGSTTRPRTANSGPGARSLVGVGGSPSSPKHGPSGLPIDDELVQFEGMVALRAPPRGNRSTRSGTTAELAFSPAPSAPAVGMVASNPRPRSAYFYSPVTFDRPSTAGSVSSAGRGSSPMAAAPSEKYAPTPSPALYALSLSASKLATKPKDYMLRNHASAFKKSLCKDYDPFSELPPDADKHNDAPEQQGKSRRAKHAVPIAKARFGAFGQHTAAPRPVPVSRSATKLLKRVRPTKNTRSNRRGASRSELPKTFVLPIDQFADGQ